MDYEAQQLQEIEALQAIYQEDELELICTQYPDIALRIKLRSGQVIFVNSSESSFILLLKYIDEIGILLEEKKKEVELKVEEEKEKAEAIERRKFEGTIVTPESFRIWKEKFDKERKALMEKKEKEREASLAGKLTGRQLFLRDATLNLSDVALIEQGVEIDESLFLEEIDGLDLEIDED
ncbi:unnamed protein product [Angiostrongylus costaricensis]|uniref:DFRP_C domain-containing protein n=1 Tax=Angiostrongylus costaricensis TaxID=334426 RepID=A0A158PM97_ANGCS|nr:unnamed protein product [Angiostrongylus costaricensis]